MRLTKGTCAEKKTSGRWQEVGRRRGKDVELQRSSQTRLGTGRWTKIRLNGHPRPFYIRHAGPGPESLASLLSWSFSEIHSQKWCRVAVGTKHICAGLRRQCLVFYDACTCTRAYRPAESANAQRQEARGQDAAIDARESRWAKDIKHTAFALGSGAARQWSEHLLSSVRR